MRLYLVRHGLAHSKDVDTARSLTEQGRKDVEKVSAFLRKQGLHVSVVWHSGKARAEQTAKIIASAIITDRGVSQHDGLAPNDPVAVIKQEILQSENDLMIVGHLPFLSKLASELISGNALAETVAFEAGGVVCLEQSQDNTWMVRWIITPELLP
jgi:phosphohistidine phosphatase